METLMDIGIDVMLPQFTSQIFTLVEDMQEK